MAETAEPSSTPAFATGKLSPVIKGKHGNKNSHCEVDTGQHTNQKHAGPGNNGRQAAKPAFNRDKTDRQRQAT